METYGELSLGPYAGAGVGQAAESGVERLIIIPFFLTVGLHLRRDLPKLLKDIELYSGTQLTRLAMKLMVLTFLRTCEMRKAEWTEFDFDNARWYVPKERMKMRLPVG